MNQYPKRILTDRSGKLVGAVKVCRGVGHLDSHGQGRELIDAGKPTCLLKIPGP
jgi:hypothetical protein